MSNWNKRLQQYEVTPPASVWEQIAASLDESASGQAFPSKLLQVEVPPPPAAWENIAAALDTQAAVPATPATVMTTASSPVRRMRPVVRYAAAAVVLGLISLAAFALFSTSRQLDPLADNSLASSAEGLKNFSPVSDSGIGSPDASVAGTTSSGGTRMAGKGISSLANTGNSFRVGQAVYSSPLDIATPGGIRASDDRYITLLNTDGQVVRVSKKLSDLACCVSGDEQDPNCKDQVKKWQEQMAYSSMGSSSGNFLDILDMVNCLNESAL